MASQLFFQNIIKLSIPEEANFVGIIRNSILLMETPFRDCNRIAVTRLQDFYIVLEHHF